MKINWNQSNLSSALVFKNLKTFLANVLALISSLISFGRLLNNLEAESWNVPVSRGSTSCGVAHGVG